jgi:hypothetical protein
MLEQPETHRQKTFNQEYFEFLKFFGWGYSNKYLCEMYD